MTEPSVRMRAMADVVVRIALAGCCVAVAWAIYQNTTGRHRNSDVPLAATLPITPLSLTGASLLGDGRAPIVIVEYSDFFCEFCRNFSHQKLPALELKYINTGQVLLAFRYLPLRSGSVSDTIDGTLVCANEQKRFRPLHDRLFAMSGRRLDQDAILTEAAGALEPEAFERCFKNRQPASRPNQTSDADMLGVTATPTFFIGLNLGAESVRVSDRIVGDAPLATFEEAIARTQKKRF